MRGHDEIRTDGRRRDDALLAIASPALGQGRASEADDFQFPGADTIALQDGSNAYGTYGASSGGRKVPYSISGSGNTVGSSPVVRGDAMPGGGGAFYHVKRGVGRYYLFYTATKKDSGGRGTGRSATFAVR